MALGLLGLIAGWVAWQAREGARRNQALLAQNYWSSAVSAAKQGEWLGAIHFSAHSATEERDPLRLKAAVLNTQAFTRSVFLGTAVAPARGAIFSRDESLVLTWSRDGTARLWNVQADYDFPARRWPLFVEVATGTAMDDAGNVRALSVDEWQQRKKDYVQIAEEHLTTCRYREANLYVKQKELWEGKRSEAGQPAPSSALHVNE